MAAAPCPSCKGAAGSGCRDCGSSHSSLGLRQTSVQYPLPRAPTFRHQEGAIFDIATEKGQSPKTPGEHARAKWTDDFGRVSQHLGAILRPCASKFSVPRRRPGGKRRRTTPIRGQTMLITPSDRCSSFFETTLGTGTWALRAACCTSSSRWIVPTLTIPGLAFSDGDATT